MGYELRITRAELHFMNEVNWITPEEWLAVVEEDPELTLNNEFDPYKALWSGPSKYADPWLTWYEGNIETKHPDEPLIEKMCQIAIRLNAKVQGDDGEIYLRRGHKSGRR